MYMITSAIAMLRDTLYASPDISPKILLKVVPPAIPTVTDQAVTEQAPITYKLL
jgi:hypothetical protein